MKDVVILAAGKSTRTYPLTLTRPKPLLYVAGKTLLEHTLSVLEELGFQRLILVVGYLKEKIFEFFERRKTKLAVQFVIQEQARGTAHALSLVFQKVADLSSPFLLLMGDDFYCLEDLKKLLEQKAAVLGKKMKNPSAFGVLKEEDGRLTQIVEKPEGVQEGIVNTGAYLLPREIQNFLDTPLSLRGEQELTDSISQLAQHIPFSIVMASHWFPLTYPWSLFAIQRFLLDQMEPFCARDALVEPGVTLKGVVHIGQGSVLKTGTYIEGPVWIGENCTLGPNCYIRPYTTLGNQVKVGHSCEVKESILFPGVKMGHLSYIGDSILGERVNVGAGTIVANLKHTNTPVESKVQGKIIDTGRRKLGAIIGDGVKLGIGTMIYPGRKIWPFLYTLPGEIVKKDKQSYETSRQSLGL